MFNSRSKLIILLAFLSTHSSSYSVNGKVIAGVSTVAIATGILVGGLIYHKNRQAIPNETLSPEETLEMNNIFNELRITHEKTLTLLGFSYSKENNQGVIKVLSNDPMAIGDFFNNGIGNIIKAELSDTLKDPNLNVELVKSRRDSFLEKVKHLSEEFSQFKNIDEDGVEVMLAHDFCDDPKSLKRHIKNNILNRRPERLKEINDILDEIKISLKNMNSMFKFDHKKTEAKLKELFNCYINIFSDEINDLLNDPNLSVKLVRRKRYLSVKKLKEL